MGKKLTGVQIGIIVATVVTALIHLGLSFLDFSDQSYVFAVLFLLNGLSYLSLLAAYFLPQPFFRRNHNLVRWLLTAFAAVTILAWLVMNGDFTDPLSLAAKASEVILIVLLFMDRSNT